MTYCGIDEFAQLVGVTRRQVMNDLGKGLPALRVETLIDVERGLEWRAQRGNRRKPADLTFKVQAAS